MKRLLFVLAVLAASVAFFSCNSESETIVPDKEQPVINEGTKAFIQNFIDQVNGVKTRVPPLDPNTQYKMRIYLTGDTDCRDGNGYCLPEVIVTPGVQKPWIHTPEGLTLQDMVNKNQITMRREFSPVSNTEFYIYNGVEDRNLEIVVPVVNKK